MLDHDRPQDQMLTTPMLTRRHHHLTTLTRLAAGVAIAGGALVACGADGGSDVALSPAAETGRGVVQSNGCAACHGRDGEGGTGPAFTGLFGSTVELEDGTTVVADADYLFESIRDPSAKLVDGYGLPMPANDLSDSEIESVIAFIEELATPAEGSG